MNKNRKLTTAIAVVLGLAVLAALYLAAMPAPNIEFPLALADERTITLAVDWDGDVHQSERKDCGVWTASFNCELRRGGDMGAVMTRTLPISATASVGEPGVGQWGSVITLTWDISALEVGPYETFARLEITDGAETLYGYVEGEGHDGDMFFVVDKFQIGAVCFVPLRFSATVP